MGFRLLVLLVTVSATCAFNAQQPHRSGPHFLSLLHARGEGPAAADLSVGTEPGKSNVVSGFEVVSTWAAGDDLAASVPPTERSTDFYLKATGGSIQFTRATVEPTNLPHLRTYLKGELSKQLRDNGQVNLRKGEEKRLSVEYDCLSQGGPSALTLTLEFEGLSAVQIPFKKTCGGERNTALTVSAGSASDGEKVVVMGMPKWDELKVVGVRPTSTVFTVFVDPLSEKGAQVIGEPKATGIGACSAVAAPEVPDGKFKGGRKNLAAGESVDIAVKYRCFRHGKCIVSAQVPFFPDMAPYQPLRWSWTKLCGGEALGIDVEALSDGKSARRLLATDGAANTSSTTPLIVDKDVTEHEVRLVNDKKRSLEPEVKVRALTIRCLDTTRCTSRFSEKPPATLKADSPIDMKVEYDCHQSGSSMVQLILATEGHDPVVATWAKDCSAFSDSLVGVCLVMILTCTCFACACVGFMKLFFEGAADAKAKRGQLLQEGEFIEDENLTQEEITALDRYEEFYGLQKGAASIEQVKDSALGVEGWVAKDPTT